MFNLNKDYYGDVKRKISAESGLDYFLLNYTHASAFPEDPELRRLLEKATESMKNVYVYLDTKIETLGGKPEDYEY